MRSGCVWKERSQLDGVDEDNARLLRSTNKNVKTHKVEVDDVEQMMSMPHMSVFHAA
jgi:hypothetical protein